MGPVQAFTVAERKFVPVKAGKLDPVTDAAKPQDRQESCLVIELKDKLGLHGGQRTLVCTDVDSGMGAV